MIKKVEKINLLGKGNTKKQEGTVQKKFYQWLYLALFQTEQ